MEDVSPSFLASFASSVSLTEPALRLFLSVLSGYPLALIHRFFIYGRDVKEQHLYFVLTGLTLGYFNFGTAVAHNIIAVIFTYLSFVIFPGSVVSVATVFVFNLTYLLVGYYYTSTEHYDVTWTMPHCILVLRLIGTAFDLYDGSHPAEKLSADAKKTALLSRPSFLEIMAHSFFPSSYLIGPQFPMRRYLDFVYGKFSSQLKDGTPGPPNCLKSGLEKFVTGVVYCVVFQILRFYVNDAYIISEEFAEETFLRRLWFLGLWGRFTLYKYISCWLLTEGACIMFGLTYNGEDAEGNTQWNGCENVKLFIFENATEFDHYIQSFNTNTNSWVAKYIYKRLKFLGNKYISQASTLLFLSAWHGLHTGYYVCFFMEFIVMYMEKDLKPIIKSNERLYNILTKPPINILVYIVLRFYTFIFMGWCLLPFVYLTSYRYWLAFKNVNWVGFILFGVYPFIYRPLLLKFVRKKKRSTEHVN